MIRRGLAASLGLVPRGLTMLLAVLPLLPRRAPRREEAPALRAAA